MSASGFITMVLVLAGIWGGFVYLLVQSAKEED